MARDRELARLPLTRRSPLTILVSPAPLRRRVALLVSLVGCGVLAAHAAAAIQAAFDCSPSCTVSPGTTVTFTSTSTSSTPIRTYEWDLDGDGLHGTDDDPDEPYGPDAQSARRTFAETGSYRVGLRVTNADAEQSTATRTVTVAAEPEPPPPGDPPQEPPPAGGPPPAQLRRVPVDFRRTTLHGPARLSASRLARLMRTQVRRRGGGGLQQAQAAHDFEAADPLTQLNCGAPCGPDVGLGLPSASPAPTKPFTCCNNGQPDPQIAASNSYLVIGNRDTLWFYDKAGQQLYTKAAPPSSKKLARAAIASKSYPYKVTLCTLFKPLIPKMNAALDSTLPHQLKDPDGNAISVQNGYGLNCDKTTGGTRPDNWSLVPVPGDDSSDGFYHPFSTIYDARVLWDEYNKRFWVAALAYNTVTQRRVVHATWKGFKNQGTYNVARARRAMLAVAVSKTGDPRGAWDLYWSWTVPGQTTCENNDCPVYSGADFLRGGISSKYLALSTNVSDFQAQGKTYKDKYGQLPALGTGKPRKQIIVLPTKPVATNSGQVVPVYSNTEPLLRPDGTAVGSIWPAVQHAPDFDSGNELFFASLYTPEDAPASHNVLLWLLPFDAGGAPQDMYHLPVEVKPFGGFPNCDAPPVQQPSGKNSCIFNPGIPNYLVYRNGSLYTAFAECGASSSGTCLYSALRFVRIQINGIAKGFGKPVTLFVSKAVDRSFVGPPNPGSPGNHAWYGFPGVDANKDGDAIIAYERSGTFVFPEARYSAYHLGEADVRASRLLMAGDSSFGEGTAPHHYMGMSVDPFDGTGIWMIHGFASGGGRSWAIGKALAPPYPDLEFEVLPAAARLIGGGSRYRLTLRVRNRGDGHARASSGQVHLVSRRGRATALRAPRSILVKRFRVPPLVAGGATTLELDIRAPLRARDHRHALVKLDTRSRLEEYAERNNTLYIRLRTGR